MPNARRPKNLARAAALTALCCVAASSQPESNHPASTLTFEVASIRPAASSGGGMMLGGLRGGPGTDDPERLTLPNFSLMNLLVKAYSVRNYQITGPSWLDSERYDVTAKLPPGTTQDQANIMLQNLLAERFNLRLHHETKEFPGFELAIGKTGSRLKPSSPGDVAVGQPLQASPLSPAPLKADANGFPMLDSPGLIMMMKMSKGGMAAHMTARAQPLSRFVEFLGSELKRPVVDKTGLAGKYDFTLEYLPENNGAVTMNGGPPPPPSLGTGDAPDDEPHLTTAIQQQLGLRLDAKKVKLDVLIIDHADKTPTEN